MTVAHLHSPVDLWDRALRHLEAAERCLQNAAANTRTPIVRATAHRERTQLQLQRDRLRPELLTLQIEANRKTPAALERPGVMTHSP